MNITSFVQRNWLSLMMVLVPAGLFLAPLPLGAAEYYPWLMILAGLAIIKHRRVSVGVVTFLIVCALSIIFGNAASLFKSWERLGLFILILMAYFPVFQSRYLDKLRAKAFLMMLFVMVFTSVGSFIGYFWGINYMTKVRDSLNSVDTVGWFGGLTYQSMMLSPICAIALTILVWALIERFQTYRTKIIVASAAFASFCCMMLTASRGGNAAGVMGVAVILFLKYRSRIGKMLQVGIIGVMLAVVLTPIYMPYADKVLSKQQNNVEAGSTFYSRANKWENRIAEFSQYPILGYGFCAIDTKNTDEYMASTGIVEPGSSWLAILSMTGILGAICFMSLWGSTVLRLYKRLNDKDAPWSLLHLGILAVFAVHFFVEGYVFAGGGALCFLFWFFFGCAYSYARNPISYSVR